MKLKLLNIITSLFIVSCIATSCLDDEKPVYEYSSDASIIAFSIKDIATKIDTTINGKDTTLTATVTGKNYPFNIDQKQGLIYNVDSLPVGTNVKKVVPEISADGYVFIVAETDSIWEEGDSLNFENPIQFKVMAMDGSYGRIYTAKVNVHQQDPETMSWSKFNSNFNKNIGKQKAVYLNQQIFVFAEQEEQIGVTIANQADGNQWTTLQAIDIPTKADYTSVIAWGESLYILASNELYTSNNGINWTKVTTEQKLKSLVASFDLTENKKLIGVTIDNLYTESVDGSTWATYGTIPSEFPQAPYSFASYPLATNNQLNRIVLMGENEITGDTTNVVWTQLAAEHEWIPLFMEDNPSSCPNLVNPSMIHYDNQLYVFGGSGKNGDSAKAFEYFYTSNDNGIGWERITKNVLFPQEFNTLYTEADGHYSYIVDNNHFLWIMWGKTGEVWRGRINRLGFVNQ